MVEIKRTGLDLNRDGEFVIKDKRETARVRKVERGSEALKNFKRRTSSGFPKDTEKAQVFVKATFITTEGKRMQTTFTGVSSFRDSRDFDEAFREALIGALEQSDIDYDEPLIIEIADLGFISYEPLAS